MKQGLLLSIFAALIGLVTNSPAGQLPAHLDIGRHGINPYMANAHREVVDLQTFGTDPVVFKRYYNSRAETFTSSRWVFGRANTWQNNWNWEVVQDTTFTNGVLDRDIHYPNGYSYTFTATDSTGTEWVPTAANCGDRLYKGSSGVYLITMPDNMRYDFVADGTGTGVAHLTQVSNQMGSNWYVQYDTHNRVAFVNNNYQRYIYITYLTSNDGATYVNSVSSNDGTVVYYNYSNFFGNTPNVLTSVTYPSPTTAATYTYVHATTATTGRPALATAVDPMIAGDSSQMKYDYSYSPSLPDGYVKEEYNLAINEPVVAILNAGTNPTIVEGDGTTITRNYNSYDQLTKMVDGDGVQTTFTYGSSGAGFLKTVTDNAGNTTTYTENGVGEKTSATSPSISDGYSPFTISESNTYDSDHFLITHTNGNGVLTNIVRNNTAGSSFPQHVITEIDYNYSPLMHGTQDYREFWSYNSNGQVLTHALKNSGIATMSYYSSTDTTGNFIGDLQTATDPLGYTTSYTYYKNGLTKSVTDARGNSTNYAYNWRGQVTSITHPDSTVFQYTYDGFGNKSSEIDENTKQSTFTYNAYNKLASKTDANNHTTSYIYGQKSYGTISNQYFDTIAQTTLPSGKCTRWVYNESRLKTSVELGYIMSSPGSYTAPNGISATSYYYDSVNNLNSSLDSLGLTNTSTFDSIHRCYQTADSLGHGIGYQFDADKNILTNTYADGTQQTNTYDTEDRLASTTNAQSEVSYYTYDNLDNILTFKDPKGYIYSYTYDLDGRKTSAIYPDSTTELFGYDAVGNMTSYTNRSGQIETLTYDTQNRLLQTSWSSASAPTINRTYDSNGRLLTCNSNVSSLTYTYDNVGQLLSETESITGAPGGARTINYTYDADGNRSAMTLPSGLLENYSYDALNRLTTINVNGTATATYTYDVDSRLATKTLANGTAATYSFDNGNRLNSITNSGIVGGNPLNLSYGYNSMNRRTYEQRNGGLGDVYGYDFIGEVTSVSYDATNPSGTPTSPSQTVGYQYDSNGNRSLVTDSINGSASYSSNNLNEYSTMAGNGLTYDTRGNLTQGLGWTYTYDAKNHLLTAANTSNSAQMSYDPVDQCATRTINGAIHYLFYDGWNLVEERDSGGNLTATYIHGMAPDEMIAMINSTSIVYYHQNALGNTTGLTDTSGNLVESYDYDVYGNTTIYNASGLVISVSSYGNRFLFTRRELLSEIGLYDYRNRFYVSVLGRFLQCDPTSFDGGDFNLYRYALNNCVNASDPTGEIPYMGPGTVGYNYGRADANATAVWLGNVLGLNAGGFGMIGFEGSYKGAGAGVLALGSFGSSNGAEFGDLAFAGYKSLTVGGEYMYNFGKDSSTFTPVGFTGGDAKGTFGSTDGELGPYFSWKIGPVTIGGGVYAQTGLIPSAINFVDNFFKTLWNAISPPQQQSISGLTLDDTSQSPSHFSNDFNPDYGDGWAPSYGNTLMSGIEFSEPPLLPIRGHLLDR